MITKSIKFRVSALRLNHDLAPFNSPSGGRLFPSCGGVRGGLILLAFLCLSLGAMAQNTYTIRAIGSSTTNFEVLKNSNMFKSNLLIQAAIDSIKTDANGAACTIQFGNSSIDTLDIGTAGIQFNSTVSPAWGKITLIGSIVSQSSSSNGIIYLMGNTSMESKANIKNTYITSNLNYPGYAIVNAGTGTVDISGGAIIVGTGIAAHSSSTGKIIISGNAILTSRDSQYGTIYIASSGSGLEITGGTITSTGSRFLVGRCRAIWNASNAAINISGGTISADDYAVYNNSTGTVNISGGTISATNSQSSSMTKNDIADKSMTEYNSDFFS